MKTQRIVNTSVICEETETMGISIKEPCHEDWTKMTSTEKGAFCQSCALEVIDFTDKTPFEIKNILFEEFSSKKSTCGRITNYQLDQINDEFFRWKNDREAFRAVWIFSLVAVFGLTLFSCQNTLSREMIEQLNTETNALLNGKDSTQIELAEVDSLTPSKNDSLTIVPYVMPWNPYGEVTNVGVLPYEDFLRGPDWLKCTFVLGDIVQSGFVSLDPEAKQFLAEVQEAPIPTTQLPKTPLPILTPSLGSDALTAERVMTAGGDKKFDAFIHPNPVDITSRLYLSVHELTNMKITIHVKGEPTPFRSGDSTFVTGRHEADLQLYKLESGFYQLKLAGQYQVSVLDFEV